MNRPTCVELFAGAGGASLGLQNAGFHSLLAVEWDRRAAMTHRAALPCPVFEGDVRKADLSVVEGPVDLLWASPPCFPAGSPVITQDGLRPIETLREGDFVLTHKGRYRPVLCKMVKKYTGDLVTLSLSYGRGSIRCTPEHPLYVRKYLGHRNHKALFGEPSWVEAHELCARDLVLEPRVSEAVPYVPPVFHQNHSLNGRWGDPLRERRPYKCDLDVSKVEVADLLGLYLAEGHRRGHDAEREGPSRREVVFSIATHELEDVISRVEAAGFKAQVNKNHSPGAARISVSSLHLWSLCGFFGDGAGNKHIPEWVFGMSPAWREALIDAYFRGDGCLTSQSGTGRTYWRATTVSSNLVCGMLRLITVTKGVLGGASVLYGAHVGVIEGRTVQARKAYCVRYVPSGKSRPGKVEAGGGWLPVRSVGRAAFEGEVHNIEVGEDNSYTVNTVAVHNCQAWSTAGRRLGAFDDRNGWPWTLEVVDRLASTGQKPSWVICENVLGLIMHRNGCPNDPGGDPTECPGCYWERWVQPEFRKRYAHVSWAVLNSADYGVAQRRRRVFLVAGPEPYPWPAPTHSYRALVRSKWVDGSYWTRHGIRPPEGGPGSYEAHEMGVGMSSPDGTLPWVTIRDAVSMGATATPTVHHADDGSALDMFGDGSPVSVEDSVVVDLPSDTLAAQASGRAIISASARRRATWTEQTGRRKYTVAECAVLQGFPADYAFQGPESLHYKQIGNSVCPPLAEALGEIIVGMVRP